MPDGGLSVDVVKTLVPMLVMGTKEKNAAVKSYSEQALVCLLRLRQDDSILTVRMYHIGSVCLSVCLFVCPSVRLSVRPSACDSFKTFHPYRTYHHRMLNAASQSTMSCKVTEYSSPQTCLTATGTHMPYGIKGQPKAIFYFRPKPKVGFDFRPKPKIYRK